MTNVDKAPVFIDDEALHVAIGHVRLGKEQAIDKQEFDVAAEWRDEEKRLLAALGDNALRTF